MSNPSTSTLATIQAIVAEELDIALGELRPDRPLEELGVDSLGIIEVMFRLEETFDIRMGDERVPIRTVQDIADNVDKLLRERDAAGKQA
jgi:acyl carrier protein